MPVRLQRARPGLNAVLLGVIADDFTGAGDVANTLARGGMRTRLFIGEVPGATACEAGVVALKTRSVRAADAVAASLAALAQLRAAGCRQILFKYCSTFDSTRDGNIGPVAEALAVAMGVTGVVVCPAFPATGRTVYQGHLFVGDRPVSETGMAQHPLTPMTDPDLRRWLAHQTAAPPGHVPHAVVRAGAAAIATALAAGTRLMIVDAVSDDDLAAIGEAVAGAALVTGGSGMALGLPANFRRLGLLSGDAVACGGVDGPALVLAGSCSVATRAQVANYAANHPAYTIDAARLLGGAPVRAEARAFAVAHAAAAPLIASSADPAVLAALPARAAAAVEAMMGELAADAVARGVRRLVVAGGETSGAVVGALGLAALDIGAEIDPGIPVLHSDGLALALKSGNFGGLDFFAKALAYLGDEA